MSETTDSTSLQGLHSVAERLKAAGFRQTGIARAVTELVWEYLGIHANIGSNLMIALWNTKAATSWVLGVKQIGWSIQQETAAIEAVNDSSFESKKSA